MRVIGLFESRQKHQLEHSIMNNTFEDIQKAAKDNMDAAVKAFGSFTKNAQTMSSETADYTKKAYEANTAHIEKLFAVKTLDKAIELNTEFAKASYEGFVAQTTKFSNLFADFSKEAMKPVEAAFAKAKTAVSK
jgi:phasin family protein